MANMRGSFYFRLFLPLVLITSWIMSSSVDAHAAHRVFANELAQDERLFPEEEYVHQGADAETFEEIMDYFPEFAARVLARFVRRAAARGFAKELDHFPTPDQTGVTEIEVSPGIIKYYDTSLIYRAIHANIIGADGRREHFHPHIDDIFAAYQAISRDKEHIRIPHYSRSPLWFKHFGPDEWRDCPSRLKHLIPANSPCSGKNSRSP